LRAALKSVALLTDGPSPRAAVPAVATDGATAITDTAARKENKILREIIAISSVSLRPDTQLG
jgi:hypothetical protein